MKLNAYINGQAIKSDKTLEVYNPSNNSLLGSVPFCSKTDIDEAFISANDAFLKFKNYSLEKREEVLNKMILALDKNKDELSTLLAHEVAKPINDAKVEITRTIDYIKETIVEYHKIIQNPRKYNEFDLNVKGLSAIYELEPIGVVLAITPFNYPINLLVAKLAPAIIAGNSVVIKSPSSGSLVTSKFIGYLHDEILPEPGLINLITGAGKEIGDYIVQNKHIKLISFTGSTNIAKKIATEQTMIPMILENGGKDPAIIFEDVDIKATAKELANGAFSFSGQRCTATKRIIAHKNIIDDLIIELNNVINAFIVGDPFLANVKIVPLINEKSLKFNLEILKDAQDKGAILQQKIKYDNNLLWPVLVSNIKTNMMIWTEEPFGPILPIIGYDTLEQAIELANDSRYGLQASIFTKDIEKAKKIVPYIDAGTININKSSSRGPDILPFFGIKDSGFGVQGIRDSILSATKMKGTVIKE